MIVRVFKMQERHVVICPVCQNTKWAEVYKIKRYNIGECAVCGFARIDPLPAEESRPEFYSKEEVIDRNSKKHAPLQRFSRTMKSLFRKVMKHDKSRVFYDKLRRYLPPRSKILDIGCGDGTFLKMAKKQFICSGIEISEYLAALAKEEDGIKIMVGNFLVADFSYQKYDGITLISILEHLDDPAGALKKCFDLMNEGSLLLIKTVNYSSLNRTVKKENWTGFRPPDHVVYFNPSNIKKLLKKVGFTKIKISAWAFSDNMYCDAWK